MMELISSSEEEGTKALPSPPFLRIYCKGSCLGSRGPSPGVPELMMAMSPHLHNSKEETVIHASKLMFPFGHVYSMYSILMSMDVHICVHV